MRELITRNSSFFLPFLLMMLGAFSLLLWFSSPALTFMINSFHSGWMDPVFEFFTDLGNGNITLFLSFLLLFTSFGRAVVMLAVSNLAGLFAQIIKRIISSPRPYLYFRYHHPLLHFVAGVKVFRDYSFPSGHTTTAFSVAVLLTLFARNKNFGYLYLVLAACVGWSRIYLGEHFFADVLAGALLGSLTSLIAWYFITGSKTSEKAWYHNNLVLLFTKKQDQTSL